MGRRKKEPLMELPVQAVPAAPGAAVEGGNAAPLREYLDGVNAMRVARFDLLSVEFGGIADAELPKFHEVMAVHVRGWMILRRLFGISPVIPAPGTSQDDLRTWPREELLASLGIGQKELREELDRLRGLWQGVAKPKAAEGGQSGQDGRGGQAAPDDLFVAEALVRRHGMEDLLIRDEIPWMASRLDACAQMLAHSTCGELTRTMIITELELRRIQMRMAKTSKEILLSTDLDRRKELEKERNWIFNHQSELMKSYDGQLDKVDSIFPFLKAAAGSMSFRAVMSDAVVCHTNWMRDPANRPADGIFTLGEIDILMRTSEQAPEPQYRLDISVYLNQARAFTFAPEEQYNEKFAPGKMKAMRAAFTAAAAATERAEGATLTNLLSSDPVKGEYPVPAKG